MTGPWVDTALLDDDQVTAASGTSTACLAVLAACQLPSRQGMMHVQSQPACAACTCMLLSSPAGPLASGIGP